MTRTTKRYTFEIKNLTLLTLSQVKKQKLEQTLIPFSSLFNLSTSSSLLTTYTNWMRMTVLCLVIILCATLLSLANSESVPNLSLQSNLGSYDMTPLDKIFHRNSTNIIHIDFNAISDKLIKVQILKDQSIVLTDSVTDLSDSSVYEVDLDKFGKGNYTISLTTSKQKVITEEFKY